MEKLSLKIQMSYVAYALLFYGVAILLYNQPTENPTGLSEGLKEAFSAIIFWITTNFFFLASVIISSISGLVYSRIKNNRQAFLTFGIICLSAIVLLLSLILIG